MFNDSSWTVLSAFFLSLLSLSLLLPLPGTAALSYARATRCDTAKLAGTNCLPVDWSSDLHRCNYCKSYRSPSLLISLIFSLQTYFTRFDAFNVVVVVAIIIIAVDVTVVVNVLFSHSIAIKFSVQIIAFCTSKQSHTLIHKKHLVQNKSEEKY